MTSSNSSVYNSDRVREVFGNLSIDKTRLPSSGLTGAGVPSFVAEWLLDKVVPGSGALSTAEAEKINAFVSKAFPRKDDANVIRYKISQGEIYKLIALLKVKVKLEQGKDANSEPQAEIPVLGLNKCAIPKDIIDRHERLLRQGVWGKISLGLLPSQIPEIIDFDPFQYFHILS